MDVGGTEVKTAVLALDGSVLEAGSWPTRREDGAIATAERVLGLGVELVSRAVELTGRRPLAAGVVVPGVVDEGAGVAVHAANLGWRELPLRARLEERLGLPVAFGHDVRAGALAEQRLGAGRGQDPFLFVPLGTGIAAGVVLGGRLVPGWAGGAGEIGHLTVRPDGELCGCGGLGCLETVASASGVAAGYVRAGGAPGSTAAQVAAAVRAGDPVAGKVWAQAVIALADALATCVTVLAPQAVAVGGGLAQAGELLLAPLREALSERLKPFQPSPSIVAAELGSRAGCLGAGLMAGDLVAGDLVGGPVSGP
ncbi:MULTISPECIES: ROK family protein [Streptacidiphilus]|uniref:ROK family protein n=1 Tax=Streptacidiphilus cavernicola TaxID=3342716 RepID=A0ABV6UYK1_9ACTN|nr:ROK family protein [Streptacidiphilus jeojiense]